MNKKVDETDVLKAVNVKVPSRLWEECKAHVEARGMKLSAWIRFAIQRQMDMENGKK